MKNKLASSRRGADHARSGLSDFSHYVELAEKAMVAGKPNVISIRDLQLWLRHFGSEAVEQTIIPRRTFMRRKARNEKLSEAETDKALRVARITIHAEKVFHGIGRAREWLSRNNSKFGGQPPLSLLRSDVGARMVEETLFQIEHGMFA